MSGPTPMALGPFQFQALGFSFEAQDREVDSPWSEISVGGRLDALHWTGPKSDTFVISGCLFTEAFGGQGSLDGIIAAQLAGRPLTLVTRAGRVHGLHVVEGTSQQRSYIRGDGMARKVQYDIKLKRYSGGFGAGFLSLF